MSARESLTEYYQRYGRGRPVAGQVTTYRIEDVATPVSFPHIRRDFYKIKLLNNAQGILSYADRQVEVQAAALVFVNPLIPYSWERTAGRETGYACLFTEEFITQQLKTASVANSPLFRVGGTPVLFPPTEVVHRLGFLFEEVLTEMQSSYAHKYDLLRNYVQLILHEALKLAPETPVYQLGTSAARISALFLDLLDQQFPLASPQHPVLLKNANEFARQLAVHTNHLNKALKDQTGKTTSEHIAEKMVAEAKSLLRHSNWSLAEISHCLGFEHTSNFNAFFKKQTGQPPHAYRKQLVSLS
ncbi:helix-turn-helix transcriptional regulator [Hymenobacter sp. GOD-10R]|uniref:helix-turn-helix domain-containing protein n=1 Tax=Hymenobacter sp. GOD-10R TaxID=3093922 RepID=UPI002D78BA7F|nr:helix-turn-helix transcriptional regulator [Hymenobacter sp. GOD-10R]WRQ29035.1 helix-turn-helix transcriptional regulator [Hymenobacter sp. GOD-10R]